MIRFEAREWGLKYPDAKSELITHKKSYTTSNLVIEIKSYKILDHFRSIVESTFGRSNSFRLGSILGYSSRRCGRRFDPAIAITCKRSYVSPMATTILAFRSGLTLGVAYINQSFERRVRGHYVGIANKDQKSARSRNGCVKTSRKTQKADTILCVVMQIFGL
jgi:hypothetical protein